MNFYFMRFGLLHELRGQIEEEGVVLLVDITKYHVGGRRVMESIPGGFC